MSDIKTRKFKCIGCGEDRPCIIEVNQEVNEAFDYMLVDDLKCMLDETNQTSFNWTEIEANDVQQRELLIDFYYKLSQRLDTNIPPISIDKIVEMYEKGNL